MRRVALALLVSAAWLAPVAPCAATPIQVPVVTDTYDWQFGETRAFSLTWNGVFATFTVQGVGTASYLSLDACCTDLFDRVKQVYPGATLQFSNLAINTYPVDMIVYDNLDLTLLKQAGMDNLATLTGFATLQTGQPLRTMPQLVFNGGYVDTTNALSPTAVPEPATLALIGAGLLGTSWGLRRRRGGRPKQP
jgi:hypothetical protein